MCDFSWSFRANASRHCGHRKGFLSGVNATEMSVQFDFSGKCRRAGSARERLHLGVRANVSGQIGQSGTLPRTEVTLERQLFGVHQKVFLKRVGAGELPLAHFTLIPPVTGVREENMLFQEGNSGVCFGALLTGVFRFRPPMLPASITTAVGSPIQS